jgi:hypothetical protein
MREQELLYNLFERHLYIFTTHHEDIPTFVSTVVEEYLGSLTQQGVIVPLKMRAVLEEDLRDEVLEMTRKKIYGFGSLKAYRTQNMSVIEQFLKKHS